MYFDFCIYCAMCGNAMFRSKVDKWVDSNHTMCSKKCYDLFQDQNTKFIMRKKIT